MIPRLAILSLPVVFQLALIIGWLQYTGASTHLPWHRMPWWQLVLLVLASFGGVMVSHWLLQRTTAMPRSQRDIMYRQIFHASPDALSLIPLSGKGARAVNERFCQITGYPFDEAMDTHFWALKLWVNPDQFTTLSQQAQAAKLIDQQELNFQTKAGNVRTGLVSARVISLSGQDYLLISLQDITERKQTEHALRESQKRYQSMVDNSVEGIFQSSLNGHYLMVNAALATIYGYDSTDELIASITDISRQLYVQPKRRAEFVAYMQLFDVVSDFESQVYRKDGSIVWIAENVRSVRDETGKLLYFEGTVQDVTERHQMEEELRQQRLRTERLLLNILPQTIAERLKRGQLTIASRFDQVTVMFADLVDFTGLSARISATELVKLLGQVFSEFDRLAEKHNLEKIKTIGDAYMVAGGLPLARTDHAAAIATMALEMQQAIAHIPSDTGEPFQLRIGINSGPIVAGVIGTKKFSYDLWGDTVNIASRMESQGLPGKIQVTETTYQLLRETFLLEERGPIYVKGRGEMTTYWLVGRKA